MTDHTTIEWTDRTWNPVTGCTKVSAGCDHCYAETIAERFRGGPAFPNGFDLQLREGKLGDPLRWRKPSKVFVNSMSDLFHDDIPDEYIAQVFAVMAMAPQHTFQVLTKRHARMRSLLSSRSFPELVTTWAWRIKPVAAAELPRGNSDYSASAVAWPLPNAWLGVSVEDQKWADIRIPALLRTPAAVRFISAEPLLGPLELWHSHCPIHDFAGGMCTFSCPERRRLDWVIAGGESGAKARPLELHWVKEIRDQCIHERIPFHFKQWGEWAPDYNATDPILDHPMHRIGKKKAGRELDGRTWDEFPGLVTS